jgi:uncharacterized paraquat-inducible protein A
MFTRRGGGRGQGDGRGQGQGPGRMGGAKAAGPGGNCLCPSCGYKTAHQVGQPCNKLFCPRCGTAMTRE